MPTKEEEIHSKRHTNFFAHTVCLLLKIYVPSKFLAVKELQQQIRNILDYTIFNLQSFKANGSQKIKQMFKNVYQIKHLRTLKHTR